MGLGLKNYFLAAAAGVSVTLVTSPARTITRSVAVIVCPSRTTSAVSTYS